MYELAMTLNMFCFVMEVVVLVSLVVVVAMVEQLRD